MQVKLHGHSGLLYTCSFRTRTCNVTCIQLVAYTIGSFTYNTLLASSLFLTVQTGTLTQNVMTFLKCSIKGVKYGEETDDDKEIDQLVATGAEEHVRKASDGGTLAVSPISIACLCSLLLGNEVKFESLECLGMTCSDHKVDRVGRPATKLIVRQYYSTMRLMLPSQSLATIYGYILYALHCCWYHVHSMHVSTHCRPASNNFKELLSIVPTLFYACSYCVTLNCYSHLSPT